MVSHINLRIRGTVSLVGKSDIRLHEMNENMSSEYLAAQIVGMDVIFEKSVADFVVTAVHKSFFVQVDNMKAKAFSQFDLYIGIILPV